MIIIVIAALDVATNVIPTNVAQTIKNKLFSMVAELFCFAGSFLCHEQLATAAWFARMAGQTERGYVARNDRHAL